MKFERIQWLRNERGMSRQALAEEMGISLSALATYERGEREPGAELIVNLARYFGVTSDYILGLSDSLKPVEEWPSAASIAAAKIIDKMKKSIDKMHSSLRHNSFGLQTFDAYAYIIDLLPEIDSFASELLVELQMEYPDLRQFGAESELFFDGKPLISAIASESKDAMKFAKRYTTTTSRVHDKIIEIKGNIESILIGWVYDVIMGRPTRIVKDTVADHAQKELLNKSEIKNFKSK